MSMKYFAIILLSISSFFVACKDKKIQNNSEKNTAKAIPACITAMIEKAKSLPVQNPAMEVWQWKVDDKYYYLVSSPCCDQMNFLYDENCLRVCAPSGGFTGRGDGKCPDFSNKAEKQLIWKDDRKRE